MTTRKEREKRNLHGILIAKKRRRNAEKRGGVRTRRREQADLQTTRRQTQRRTNPRGRLKRLKSLDPFKIGRSRGTYILTIPLVAG